ncbi:DNA-binding transcriptional regulator GbsR (MarR family) [Kribbella aluminosa]|uniref:DNA-binding transcriptional regulator GbsR (MarR family) n=1 Tax=Kribbella aluminosa TaxID=416017 RepID=A0ABS4UHD3_9ACTN|nr:MarR family transcriptional regulator [Kribbella aluminosa]MBP2351057.1 DNA-binding transcriptional regulator GbsR (MarR family) [Kribbella aluminosa]
MSDEPLSDDDWEEDTRRADFVEQFALLRELAGSPRMEGRVLGYLMVSNKPYVASAELTRALSASAGSISSATRRLIDLGFIGRHAVPGDRNHYFKVEDDVWGSFLAGERRSLGKQRQLFDDMIAELPEGMAGPRKRLKNARNYFDWLAKYHRKMLADWQEHRDKLEAASDQMEGE